MGWRVKFALLLLVLTATASAQDLEGRMRGARLEVESTYETLRTFNGRDVKAQFAKLSPAMQGDVWTLHLLRVMAAHPELTHEQRGVLFEALGLIASGAFEADRNSPEWNQRVREPLAQIEKRARALLSPELVQVALFDLSPVASLERLQRRPSKFVTNETCHCNTTGTDCSPSVPCVRTFPRCTLAQGCGPMYLDGCNGLCQF